MNYHLTYKQAIRKFGGVRKMRTLFDKIAKKNGIRIFVEHQFNEEESEDMSQDWANLLFFCGFSEESHKGFIKAGERIETELRKRGLDYEYECSGDGDGEIIKSYRIVGC